MRKSFIALTGAASAITLALTGCSNKAADDSPSKGGGGSVKTDIGVTADKISLGVLTDTSGPFKSGGLSALYGHQIWAKEVNDAGGVCGRKIELDVKDHGYKADNAVPLYSQMVTNDLGLMQLLGSPMLAALKTKLSSDKMLAAVPSMASNNLDTGTIISTTATYDIEMLNGLAYMQKQGKLKDGDKIGAIFLSNEAGENAMAGVKAYAKKHNITVVESPIAATDTDMTATVTKLKSDGVTLMTAMTSPATVSSIGVQMKAQSMNMPLLGWGPTYAPTLTANPEVVAAMKDNFYLSASAASWTLDSPTAKTVRDEFKALKVADPASSTIFVGYLAGKAWEAILKEACSAGDLTRAGVMKAREKVDNVKTDGLSGTLDFSDPGAPTTRETYISQLDASAEGGTKEVGKLFMSDEAKAYKAPYQK
ncbi:ABC transporter substrate-binding protein [Cumulibacter manganitolerans]|uniref:ABC transporter substrate-binding protein n=1 Tax=Cumulibacter manganitolerans TaxID=1884992 RepID=UPI0012975617|nr:ABC transporter substrate-binding protein [Cumulibacter manganitolerans]